QPAKVRTVRRTRMVEPPRSERRTIPARYETVVKQVVVQPPRLIEVELPAEYADIDVRVMVQPERTDMKTISATYRTVERKVVTSRGGLSWSEVLCDTNTTRMKVREIQRALVSAGYPILVDGLYGPQTQQAMERYQREKGLAVGYMTVETVRSLGIDPYT
ncbi:MAG: peptidoglycan-binding domain-containing protein, partial [Pseudomonadota bacterium]